MSRSSIDNRLGMAGRLLPLLGLLLLAGAAPREGLAGGRESDFWPDIIDPGRKRFQQALARGRRLYDSAVNMRSTSLRRGFLRDALGAFDEACRASPGNAEGFFWKGKALYELDRMPEAIQALRSVRRLDPEFSDDYAVAFKLGIALSKTGAFERAVLEYDRAGRILAGRGDRSTSTRNARSTLQANAAESLMAVGRLEEAIQRYREALALQPLHTLAWWGLAVALDRDEQISKAMEATNRALSADPDLRLLSSDGVFFVPPGDAHYYFALGRAAKGDLPGAREEWERFQRALPTSAWAFRARAHLAQLGVSPQRGEKKRRLAPVPSGNENDSSVKDQVAIRYRLQGSLYQVRRCYQKELRQRPAAGGTMRIAFTVGREGRAQEVKVLSSTVRSAPLLTCVFAAIKGIYFSRPASGKPVKISYPFEFKPVP